MRPVWKSEAEYNACFSALVGDGTLAERFEKFMSDTAKYLSESASAWLIDDQLEQNVKAELSRLESKPFLNAKVKKAQKKNKQGILAVLQCLRTYAEKKGIPYKFVLLAVTQFNSGFSKPDFAGIKIVFHDGEKDTVAEFGTVASSIQARPMNNHNYFYLFYTRTNTAAIEVDKREICKNLCHAVLDSLGNE